MSPLGRILEQLLVDELRAGQVEPARDVREEILEKRLQEEPQQLLEALVVSQCLASNQGKTRNGSVTLPRECVFY